MKRVVFLIATGIAVFAIACSSDGDNDDDSASGADASPTVVATATSSATAPAATATTAPPSASPTVEPTIEPTAPAPTQPAATQPPATEVPATATLAPQPTSAPAPTSFNITAAGFSFNQASITVPANSQITANFTNNDSGIPHNFGISGLATGPRTATCSGSCTDSITFNSGAAGTFAFQCTVHPSMNGSFIVQ